MRVILPFCVAALFATACTDEAPECADAPRQERTLSVYDAQGRLVQRDVVRGDALAHRRTWTFDAEGRVQVYREEDPPERVATYHHAYDAGGRLVEKKLEEQGWSLRYRYDAKDRVSRIEGVGSVLMVVADERTESFLDDPVWAAMWNAEVARAEADGPARKWAQLRTYQADGELVERTWDFDEDGIPEARELFVYADEGRRTELQRVNAEGAVLRVEVRVVDAEDRLILEEERDAAGVLRRSLSVRHEADRRVELRDHDGDGQADQRTILHLDASGQRTLKEEDYDMDGRTDWRKTYHYGADGLRTHEQRDEDVDGFLDQRTDYLYDAAGREVEVTKLEAHRLCVE
jgi:YD repeat-containing protein